MTQSHFSLRLPSNLERQTEITFIPHPPEAMGRKLANGTILVRTDASPSLIYKFNPWGNSDLAFHEIDIYSALKDLDDASGIVGMKGISSTKDHLVRVMEWSPKGQLDKFLLDGSKRNFRELHPALAHSLATQVADAMARVHAIGLVHRDLKAENILIFNGDADVHIPSSVAAKLADFDRAVILPKGGMLEEPAGSLFHMAPELLAGHRYDRKVDIYAFGILLFEITHGGMRPYSNVATGMPGSLTRNEFAEKVFNDDHRPEWLRADDDLKQLAMRCWAANPHDRPEFSDLLEILSPARPARAISVTQTRSTLPGNDRRIGIASTIGKVRKTMEDAVSVLTTPDMLICGVFDGLKGSRSSEFSARCLPLALAGELIEARQGTTPTVQHAFATVQSTLRRMSKPVTCGSTATLAMISQDDIKVTWLGDSPAWLFRKAANEKDFVAISLINPHHPDRPDDAERIMAHGGEVRRDQQMLDSGEMVPWGPLRVFTPDNGQNQGVALSRCLGLFPFSSVITAEPETTSFPRHPDDLFLVIGSDGIFEVLPPSKVYEIIKASSAPQSAAEQVIQAVLAAGAPDNASIVVIGL